ncbi:MAG: hypothetical protein O8C62_00545 [Candidatus Methanoperedens sp.]|nr:hypothetical protein [Candidatus Methanoperedens sp.]
MRKISALLAVILLITVPVLADINQKASIDGGNLIDIKVNQEAWNYGSGNINQDIAVSVTGNNQNMYQYSFVDIQDSNYTDDITITNTTLKGLNLIRIDLSQYANNTNSGNVSQNINAVVTGNNQFIYQYVDVIESWVETNNTREENVPTQ